MMGIPAPLHKGTGTADHWPTAKSSTTNCTEPESIARAAPPLEDYVVLGNSDRLAQ
jgi:hypothetical protein